MSNDNQSAEVKTKKITAGFVISWVLAVLFGVPGLIMLFQGKILTGLLFIIIALVLLPPLNTWIEKRTKFALSGGLKAILVIILMIAAGSSLGTSAPSNPAIASTSASSTASTVNTTKAPAQPPIDVSATDLSNAYNDNEVAADAQYKGKVVDVSGTIDTIGKDVLGNPYVALKTGEYSPFEVQCMFSDADEATLANLSSGQVVTLQGTVAGKPLDVEVDGCSVVN